jgi:hypothetical protein
MKIETTGRSPERRTEVADALNAGGLGARLRASREIGKRILSGELGRTVSGELNNHVHTSYSFSPYSPSLAAFKAWEAGLMAVGIMDHDSVSGCVEMLDAAANIGIASTVGFELRVNMTGTAMEGRKINNPDSENIIYIAVHGIPRDRIAEAAAFLEPIHEARNLRNRKMVAGVNKIIAAWGLEPLDYRDDVEGISRASEGGSITERHVLYALANRVMSVAGKGRSLLDFLAEKAGLVVQGKIREYLQNDENPHYSYDLLGLFKSSVISDIYIQPGNDECVGVNEAVAFAKDIGAIPAYAYLGDVTDSPTGDKKAEAFEDSYLDELFEELKTLKFQAVTYMPPRNTIEQLRRVQSLCAQHGLMEISGVDINSSRQSFGCPELLQDEFRHLGTSAWALIAHEKLSSADKTFGLFHPDNPLQQDLDGRIATYGGIGEALDPRDPESALAVFERVVK